MKLNYYDDIQWKRFIVVDDCGICQLSELTDCRRPVV